VRCEAELGFAGRDDDAAGAWADAVAEGGEGCSVGLLEGVEVGRGVGQARVAEEGEGGEQGGVEGGVERGGFVGCEGGCEDVRELYPRG